MEEVLQSKCFRRATTLRSLLLYLWKNRENEISEYAIAVEALGRNQDFESKIDASVRVQISRLRQFLTKYYESEGRHSRARLVIPLGTHHVQLIEAPPEDESGEYGQNGASHHAIAGDGIDSVSVLPSHPAPNRTGRFLVPALIAIIVVLAFCVGWLLWSSNRQNGKSTVVSKQDLPLFWRKFMDNGKSTRIVLPTPIFFTWGPPHSKKPLMARDVSVNDFAKFASSSEIADLERRLGKPQPWRNYTVASDTFASLRLARFFDNYGIQTSISSSTESPQGIIDHENIVVFGTPSSLASDYQPELDRLSFSLAPYPYERYVVDKRLPAGSPGEFPALEESASRTVTPGIIALLPRGSVGSRILIVQGLQTTALISYLISEEGMREITRAQSEGGNSPFFEAVVLSEVNAGTPIQSRLVAFRPFAVQRTEPGQTAEASLSSRAGDASSINVSR